MSATRRTGVRTPGYTRVKATPEEIADYAAKHNGRRPAVERSVHECGTRIWHSGLAVGSHGRACRGAQGMSAVAPQPAPALQWARPVRLDDTAGMLRYALVHPSKGGEVLLESGAPMTDGSTAYLVWLRVDDSAVGEPEGHTPYLLRNGDPVGRFGGRFYAHLYDEGGLSSAKATAEDVLDEVAP